MSDPSSMSNAELAQALGLPSPPAFGVGQVGPTGSTPAPVQQQPLPPLSNGAAPDLGNLSDAQIRAFLGMEPKMGTGEDIARTIPGALGRVASGIIGAPGDALNVATNAAPFLFHEAKNALTGSQGMDAADKAQPYQPYNYAGMIGFPTSEQENAGVQALAGQYHQPQSIPARAVDTAIQMAPMALLPGSFGARAARVALPAVGSEAAGEWTHGTSMEPYARLAGALSGGGVAALSDQLINAPNIALGSAVRGVDPVQVRQAMEDAQGAGINITPAEASGNTGLLRLQHFIENQRRAPGSVGDFFEARPEQVSQAVNNFADTIAPATRQPGMLGLQAQNAAQGGLDNVRQTINAVADPAYAALSGQEIPAQDFQQILANPSYQRALQAVRSDPELNASIAHLPDNNLAVVNETNKQLSTMSDAARQTEMNPQGNNRLAALRGDAQMQADALARGLSPDYADAHDIVSGGREALLDPLQAGPAGRIATTQDVKAQAASLFPNAPPEGQTNETAQALRLIGTRDDSLPGALLRQHLMNTYNEAGQDLQGGQNQYGGAKWVAQTSGNPEQRATLEGGIAAVNPDLSDPYANLAAALRATGRRLQPGSQTAFNEQAAQAMHLTPPSVRTLGGVLDPLEWGKHIDNALGNALYGRIVRQQGNFLTGMSPQDAEAYLNSAIARGTQTPSAAQILAMQLQAGNQQ